MDSRPAWLEDLDPFVGVDPHPALLCRDDPNHLGVQVAEAVEHACYGVAERGVQELSPISQGHGSWSDNEAALGQTRSVFLALQPLSDQLDT